MTPPSQTMRRPPIPGMPATATHWFRAIKFYGWPPDATIQVRLYWPLSDPKPTKGWW